MPKNANNSCQRPGEFWIILQKMKDPKSRIMVGDISNELKNHENLGTGDFNVSRVDLTSAPWSRIMRSPFWKTLFKTFPIKTTPKIPPPFRAPIGAHFLAHNTFYLVLKCFSGSKTLQNPIWTRTDGLLTLGSTNTCGFSLCQKGAQKGTN